MCWKAIRTQQMRGFSVQPCPLARLPLSWVHCHQWFTEWTVVFLAVAVTVWADWDCIPSIRFFFLHFLHFFFYQMSQTVQTFSLSESDAAPIALLSDMFVIWQMGWWKDLNSIRKAQEGTPRCQTISQKPSVINMSSKNITHPWRQMCILNSSSEGSGVGESIHLKTIYYILLIWPAYWDRLI